MVISPSNLDTIFQSVSLAFQQAYMNTAPEPLEALSQRLPCAGRDLRLPIVQTISSTMRLWTGDRQPQNLDLDGVVITPGKYEQTLGLGREDIENDQYGVFSSMAVPMLAASVKALPGQLIAAAIAANAIGYDGVATFSASHPIDPSGVVAGTQSNSLTASPLNATNLAIARATMATFKRPDGVTPMGVQGQTLLVPPSLELAARTLANAAFYPVNTLSGSGSGAGSASNVWQGAFDVVVSARLPDTGNPLTAVWYLLDNRYMGGAIKPVQFVEKEAPEFASLIAPENPVVFMTDTFMFGVRYRAAAAIPMWFLWLKVSGS